MATTLENKTAIITGGTTGIGYAAAKAMVREGARVVITGQDEARVAQAAESLAVTGVVVPSQDLSSLDRLVETVESLGGGVDIVFANAGVTWSAPFDQVTSDDLNGQMAINFAGPFFLIQKLSGHLNTGASVVFTASCLDQLGMSGMSVYSASKAALRSLARSLSAELKDRGIRVNTLAPGPVETPIYSKLGMDEQDLAAMAEGIKSQVPLGRFGSAEEIAEVALFLASDASGFMLGEEVTVDGGWSNL